MKFFIRLATLSIFAFILASCSSTSDSGKNAGNAKSSKSDAKSSDPFAEGATLYTLTNLHPDPKRKLYSTNLLQPGLIPRCSAVSVVDKGRKRLTFSLNGTEYTFNKARSTPETLDEILKKYFGRSCDKNAVSKMSATDQKGIRDGKAYKGMTRQGVTYALGHPLLSDPTLWTYHKMIFGDRVTVEFNASGIVTKVTD